jgi:hypothetical protein
LLAWRLGVLIEGARFDEDRIPFDSGDGFFNAGNDAAQVTHRASACLKENTALSMRSIDSETQRYSEQGGSMSSASR